MSSFASRDFWLSMVPLCDCMEFGNRVALALEAENGLGIGPMIVDARIRRAM